MNEIYKGMDNAAEQINENFGALGMTWKRVDNLEAPVMVSGKDYDTRQKVNLNISVEATHIIAIDFRSGSDPSRNSRFEIIRPNLGGTARQVLSMTDREGNEFVRMVGEGDKTQQSFYRASTQDGTTDTWVAAIYLIQ